MKFEQKVTRCHLAGLRQDIIPPDPRLYLKTVAPNEVAISLGSMIFFKAKCQNKGRSKRDIMDHATSPESDGPGDDSYTPEFGPSTRLVLKCSLFKNQVQLSDTVQIQLDSNKVSRCYKSFDFTNVHFGNKSAGTASGGCSTTRGNPINADNGVDHTTLGNTARNRRNKRRNNKQQPKEEHEQIHHDTSQRLPRVKHRRTYMGGSSTRKLSGTNFSRCTLCNHKDKTYFRLKSHRKFKATTRPVPEIPHEDQWYTVFNKMMQQLGLKDPRTSARDFMNDTSQNKLLYKIKYSDKIGVPIIVNVDTILRFQLKDQIDNTVVLRTGIYIQDQFLGTSDLEIVNLKLEGYVNMFYDQVAPLGKPTGTCDIRSCCCSSHERIVCASHSIQLLDEIKRLTSFIFTYGIFMKPYILGKYRYLLYLYLQVLSYSVMGTLQTCVDIVPLALMTLGVVQFDGDTSNVGHRGFMRRAMSVPTVADTRDPSFVDIYQECTSVDTEPLGLGTNMNAELIDRGHNIVAAFQHAEMDYRTYNRARRVAMLYVDSADRNIDIRSQRFNAMPMSIPIFAMPTLLEFSVDPVFYSDSHLICRMMTDALSVHSGIFFTTDVVYFPEPREVAFLKSLVSTPLYNVGVVPGKLDTLHVQTTLGPISYRMINKLMWKYVPALVRNKDTLSLFLRFIDWEDPSETKMALRAMLLWETPGLATLLELLSRDFQPPHVPEDIQRYAAAMLIRKYGFRKLVPFFPQLVSAPGACYLMNQLIMETPKDRNASLHLYWALESWQNADTNPKDLVTELLTTIEGMDNGDDILSAIGAQRALRQRMHLLMQQLKSISSNHEQKRALLARSLGGDNCLEVFNGLGPQLSGGDHIKFDMPIPLFTDPSLVIQAIETDKCNVIKTGRYPLLLTFEVSGNSDFTQSNSLYDIDIVDLGKNTRESRGTPSKNNKNILGTSLKKILFKDGDDLRLDQLCQQIAKLSDLILRQHGIESHIMTYNVVATSSQDGFVEFLMDTKPLSAVMSDHGSIAAYLLGNYPSHTDMSYKQANFIGSLASYSAITYLLGVGDRHNDNLIISQSGHVIHVDYGYVLGSDPRPLPVPPFKLSKELLDFVGGSGSFMYRRFKHRFYVIFSILKRHAKLFIILCYLLVGSNLRNVNLESVVKMEAKFHLSDDSPVTSSTYVNSLIESSATALSSELVEKWHQFAMSWK
ncbi:hypothetical protein BaOVIS_031150 [Babesia ovis]|uniref:Phosphatidylinositol 3-kinase n=1 Tax=Babesia ovis TaxID=5869 RepID=A0A9W5TDF6_BABOV|nr:hypothetical protein BaOVIS_031150 [Babesia ovis]